MYLIYNLFVFSSFLEKANRFLLPCPFKYLTGYDCPGCGFQRSFLALLQGNLHESFHLYPPAIPVLITLLFGVFTKFWPGHISKNLIQILFLLTGSIIMLSYIYKMCFPHAPH